MSRSWDRGLRILAIVLMLAGAVILALGDGTAIGFAAAAIGVVLEAVVDAEKRRHGPAR